MDSERPGCSKNLGDYRQVNSNDLDNSTSEDEFKKDHQFFYELANDLLNNTPVSDSSAKCTTDMEVDTELTKRLCVCYTQSAKIITEKPKRKTKRKKKRKESVAKRTKTEKDQSAAPLNVGDSTDQKSTDEESTDEGTISEVVSKERFITDEELIDEMSNVGMPTEQASIQGMYTSGMSIEQTAIENSPMEEFSSNLLDNNKTMDCDHESNN